MVFSMFLGRESALKNLMLLQLSGNFVQEKGFYKSAFTTVTHNTNYFMFWGYLYNIFSCTYCNKANYWYIFTY